MDVRLTVAVLRRYARDLGLREDRKREHILVDKTSEEGSFGVGGIGCTARRGAVPFWGQ